MEQKFQRGFRVEILSRRGDPLDKSRWENTGVGKEAIIEYSDLEKPNTDNDCWTNYDEDGPHYRLLIKFKDNWGSMYWYEEKFLQLICCNADKGKKILAEQGK